MALINTTTTGVLGSTFFGDGTGSLTVQQNGVTLGTYGNIPAFSAYNSGLSVASATWTKITFSSEEFDTNSNYDTSTSRFTPTVTGYYQIESSIGFGGMTTGGSLLAIYKNGSLFKYGAVCASVSAIGNNVSVACIVYLNGSTDYVEVYGYQNSGSNKTTSIGIADAYFQGILIKAV
jgi:hypothetical protein